MSEWGCFVWSNKKNGVFHNKSHKTKNYYFYTSDTIKRYLIKVFIIILLKRLLTFKLRSTPNKSYYYILTRPHINSASHYSFNVYRIVRHFCIILYKIVRSSHVGMYMYVRIYAMHPTNIYVYLTWTEGCYSFMRYFRG